MPAKINRAKGLEKNDVLNIFKNIADEVGVSRDELDEETEFTDLGIDKILASSTISTIAEKTGLRLPDNTFNDYSTVGSLQSHLQDSQRLSVKITKSHGQVNPSLPAPTIPLSIVLQGKIASAKTIIFLLPDGSGTATAYLRLPAIDPSACIIGMNSPFLNAGEEEGKFSVESIAAVWADEIRRQKPEGPYVLGGWSAGGYYSFEVAKYLIRKGERVQKLVLIDSPCRLEYEELPMEVVHHLSRNNLMGNWGTKEPPPWVISHFNQSIRAIAEYTPTTMEPPGLPEVFIIWADDGVLKNTDAIGTKLDMNVKVTRMLLLRPDKDGPLGWDGLFPGAKLFVANMPGNHFTIIHPPHVS